MSQVHIHKNRQSNLSWAVSVGNRQTTNDDGVEECDEKRCALDGALEKTSHSHTIGVA